MDCSCHNNTWPGEGAKFGLKSPGVPTAKHFCPHKILRVAISEQGGLLGRFGLEGLRVASDALFFNGAAAGTRRWGRTGKRDWASVGGTAPQGGWRQLGSGWSRHPISRCQLRDVLDPVSSRPHVPLFGQCADRSVLCRAIGRSSLSPGLAGGGGSNLPKSEPVAWRQAPGASRHDHGEPWPLDLANRQGSLTS